VSGFDLTFEPERQVRRFEVINGAGGRRRWSLDEKSRIVAETLVPGAVVLEVARRHGLRPQQVFTWRREARKLAASATPDAPAFVPAVVAGPMPGLAAGRPTQPEEQKASCDAGVIELEIGGIPMRVGRGADADTIAAVIRALKAA